MFADIDMGPPGAPFPTGPLLAVMAESAGVRLTFGDASVSVVADWLRDNCPCPECRIVQTDERRRLPWLDRGPAAVRTAGLVTGDLHVEWVDGHRSRFDAEAWARIRQSTRRGRYTARLWGAGDTLGRFAHDEVVADDGARRSFYEAFRRDGVAVVVGSPTAPGSVVDLARNLGIALVDSSLGFIFDVLVDPAGYNVAFTAEAVPPHNDNAQYAVPPSGQILAMLVNDAVGGESSVIDGWAVLHRLEQEDPAAVEVLSRVEVGFRQYSRTADGFTRAPLVRRDAHGRFAHLRFSNQLMQPLPFDHPELAAWYRAYRELGRFVTDPAHAVSFRLAAGDTLFVNGHRVLHARAAFRPEGARHLQDVYFQVDDVLGQLARLSGEATDAMVQG